MCMSRTVDLEDKDAAWLQHIARQALANVWLCEEFEAVEASASGPVDNPERNANGTAVIGNCGNLSREC